jgi:hypothetical protein
MMARKRARDGRASSQQGRGARAVRDGSQLKDIVFQACSSKMMHNEKARIYFQQRMCELF